ncbi:hypothetical protein ACFU3O_01935 [Streptomyces antibioticus]|uniref:hypothetical protein n=1 Tax=Streptomyces antibioticus TaxID=1890 RepID=UPI0036749735
MALTVGELNAVLTVDDRAMDPGLRRAERALRQAGQRMGDDADDVGQQVGEQLGQGLVRGADGQWRNLRGELVDAATAAVAEAEAVMRRGGQRAGAALGDGLDRSTTRAARQAGDHAGNALADGVGDGAGEAVTQAGGKLEKLKSVAGGAALAAGAAAGALLVSAFSDAMEQGRLVGKLQAQLGATPAEAKRYGQIAGRLYTSAVTDTFEEGTQAIRHAMQSGLIPADATNAQIESITRKVSDLSKAFDIELADATVAVGQMIRTGMVKDASEGLDLIGKAFQINDKRADDMLETLNEYPTQFRDLGLTGSQALGIMQQGFDGASKDSDKVADALKELNIRVQSLDAADGLKKLKIDAKEAAAAFAKGGPEAAAMLDKITDRLRAVKDPTERYALAQALLGTQSEDLSKALLDIDPSEADKRLGKFKGTVDAAGDAMRDNAGTKVEAFKRGLQQGLVDFLGGPVLGTLSKAKGALGGIWDDAGKGGEEGVDRVIGFVSLLGKRVKEKLLEDVGPKVISGLSEAGEKVAEWVLANPTKVLKIAAIAAAITMAIVMLPTLVAFALQAAAVTMVVGFVGRLISALNENVPKWWDSFTGWISQKASEAGTWMAALGVAIGVWFSGLWSKYVSGPVSRQWAAFLKTVQELPARTVIALASLAGRLGEAAARGWQSFRDSASKKADAMITWVKRIPGRAKTALGNLSSYLSKAGGSLIQGFIDGIKAKIGKVRSAASDVLSAAREYFPFSPAKKGPFSGRGYTTYSGRALIAGFAKGIEGEAPSLRRQMLAVTGSLPGLGQAERSAVNASMASLVDTPAPGDWAAGTGASGVGRQRPAKTVIELRSGGSDWDNFLIQRLRRTVAARGGDVQFIIGQGGRR